MPPTATAKQIRRRHPDELGTSRAATTGDTSCDPTMVRSVLMANHEMMKCMQVSQYIINVRSHFPNHSCTYQDVMSAIKIQGESQARAADRQSQTVETLVKTLQTERAKAAKRKLEKRVRKSKSQVIDAKELEMKLLHQLSVQDPPLSVAPAAAIGNDGLEKLPPGGLKSPPELVGNPTLKEFARWESRWLVGSYYLEL